MLMSLGCPLDVGQLDSVNLVSYPSKKKPENILIFWEDNSYSYENE